MNDLLAVIRDVHSQHADDLCWMDIDRIFAAAGLPVPDRRVGNKELMKANCHRFIDTMCAGGKWKSYAQLERELTSLRKAFYDAAETYPSQHIMAPVLATWWKKLYDAIQASSTEVESGPISDTRDTDPDEDEAPDDEDTD